VPQTANARIRGLGAVSVSSLAVITETPLNSGCWVWRLTGAVTVAGKGEIEFTATDPGCQQQATASLSYTVTAGTGPYAGASGSGALTIPVFNESAKTGFEHLDGSLSVPELAFDTTPSVLKDAVLKTVRAKSRKGAVVRYSVTATDAVDGTVPASCKPPSGSRFRIGTTRVRCSATDASGNIAAAAFKVTVRR
jgi:hypothetical protein